MDDEGRRAVTGRAIAEALDAMRLKRPLVQSITNFVSMDIAANALLAAGATPAMVHAIEEVDEFGALINALVVNIGTLSTDWVTGMHAAARAARARGKPWVLDPVGAGATTFRTRTVVELLEHRPAVIRGNASEILAVASAIGLEAATSRGRGVDSGNTAVEAEPVAAALAAKLGCVVVATGETDVVSDGSRSERFGNGSVLMTLVTAVGCSLSAVTGAYCGVRPPFEAACAAVAHFGIAGEMAGEDAALPGLFRVALIDRLASIGEADILARLKLR